MSIISSTKVGAMSVEVTKQAIENLGFITVEDKKEKTSWLWTDITLFEHPKFSNIYVRFVNESWSFSGIKSEKEYALLTIDNPLKYYLTFEKFENQAELFKMCYQYDSAFYQRKKVYNMAEFLNCVKFGIEATQKITECANQLGIRRVENVVLDLEDILYEPGGKELVDILELK